MRELSVLIRLEGAAGTPEVVVSRSEARVARRLHQQLASAMGAIV